jgi:hypothetical protein
MSLKIRDFIYLDTERLKSIIAQVEKGLLDSSSQTKSDNKEITSDIEGSLFGLVKAAGGANYVLQNQTTETKTLHDNIYNRVENALIKNNSLIRLPGNIDTDNILKGEAVSILNDTSFVLAKGKVVINDFVRMRLMFDNFNEIASFIAKSSVVSLPTETSTQKYHKKQETKKATAKMSIDESLLKGLKVFFDIFYKDRVVIKMLPFEDFSDFRLVGNIKSDFLREDIASIIYKYGTAPVSEWTIFAQVASIPTKDRSKVKNIFGSSAIESALTQMFDAFREVELMAQSVVYPEIAVTPIAIYRD